MADSNSYPMISEKNWWTIREKFKASLPAIATPNYVKTLLTLSSDSSANSNVITPMRRIGLLDEENKPTALANDWRLDNKYKEVCSSIIKNVYPTELLDLFPDSNVDRASARNWFMSQGVGQGAADKMVALFMLLKSGEIKDKNIATPKKSGKAVSKIAKPQAPSKSKEDSEPSDPVVKPQPHGIAQIFILICKSIYLQNQRQSKLKQSLRVWPNTYMELETNGVRNRYSLNSARH